jgi:hypothetical protein
MKIELVTTLKRQPTAYLVNVKDYEFMQQRMKRLEGVARGEQAIRNGNTFSNQEAKE